MLVIDFQTQPYDDTYLRWNKLPLIISATCIFTFQNFLQIFNITKENTPHNYRRNEVDLNVNDMKLHKECENK